MEASITLKKVGKIVGDKTILAGLSFGVERGSLVAIVGLNDSGKSVIFVMRDAIPTDVIFLSKGFLFSIEVQ